MITSDVSTKDAESRPDAILHADELLERVVGWVRAFAEPCVTYTDIEGVIVANPPGDYSWLLYHILPIEEKPLTYYTVGGWEPCNLYKRIWNGHTVSSDK